MKQKSMIAALFVILCSVSVYAQRESKTFPQPRSVFGRSEQQPHIGFLVGSMKPADGGDAVSQWGFDVGYQPYVPFGVSLEYARSEDKINSLLAKGTYNFGGEKIILRDSYVGAAAGDNGFGFVAGPLVGFDIPLTRGSDEPGFSLGANAKYLYAKDLESQGLSVNGMLKYWF